MLLFSWNHGARNQRLSSVDVFSAAFRTIPDQLTMSTSENERRGLLVCEARGLHAGSDDIMLLAVRIALGTKLLRVFCSSAR